MAAYKAGVNLPIVTTRLFNKLACWHLNKGVKYLFVASQLKNDSSSSNNSTESENEAENIHEHEEEIRHQILNAALPFVPQHGWTKYAIAAGAESVGFPGVAHGMFPKGGVELIHHFYSSCNMELEKELEVKAGKESDLTKEQLKPFLMDAVKLRLLMILPYLDKWPQAMAIMALPQNFPQALKNLTDLIDIICYYGGDRSVTFDWYTKRLSLAAVYKSTEFCYLQDSSPDHKATWEFLNRRLDNFISANACREKVHEGCQITIEVISGGLITVTNILGLNHLFR